MMLRPAFRKRYGFGRLSTSGTSQVRPRRYGRPEGAIVSVRIELFGPPRVRRDGVDVRFDTRKAPALLAVLAVTGEVFAREALAALLWPELERTRARATLRRTLSVAAAVGPALVMDADRVWVDADAVACDVVEFRRLVASGDPTDWASAVGFPADRFLDGFSLRDSPPFDEWMLGVADGLRDDLARTLARLVADAVSAGEWAAALESARRRVQVEPLSEPAHADLIRVSAWSGDRPGALQAYRGLVRLLDRELGVAPLPETLALHEDIRADRLAPPAVALRTAWSSASRGADSPHGGTPAPAASALPHVGRDDQLARLRTAWAEAPASAGLVGVVGEPGHGKSSLLAAIAGEADGRVVRIAGRASEKMLAYAAANDLVRAMLSIEPELTGRLGASAAPLAALATQVIGVADSGGGSPRGIRTPGDLERVHEAVRAAVEQIAVERPLLLEVDDAELLDRPSATLLGYLARRLPAGVLFIVAWAPGLAEGPLPEAVAERGETLALPSFDLEQIAELAGDLDPDEVLRRTRGIPLLVRELLMAPSAAEADQVRDIVASRFSASSETARQIVTAAVVIGTVAAPELLRAVSGRDENETVDAIEEAVSRGLLVEQADGSGYDAPHDLVRGAALSGLSLARRRLLHSRIADALARRHAIDPLATPAGAIAQHLARSGREEEAAEWYLSAAAESGRVSAHEEALVQLRDALALGRRGADVHASIGSALVRLGRYDEALVALDQAAATAEGDPARRGDIEHRIADVYDRLGDWELAQAHLEAASELSVRGDGHHARVLADLALVRHRRGREAEARATAEAAVEASASGDGAARAQAGNVLGMVALAEGDATAAQEILAEAVAGARATGDDDLVIAALNNHSRALAAGGAAERALETAQEALTLAQRGGDRHRLAALHSHLADLLHAAGREEDAMAQLKLSAAAFADIQDSAARPEVWTLTEW
jgi:DNA-binding SARP family transcriptional activator